MKKELIEAMKKTDAAAKALQALDAYRQALAEYYEAARIEDKAQELELIEAARECELMTAGAELYEEAEQAKAEQEAEEAEAEAKARAEQEEARAEMQELAARAAELCRRFQRLGECATQRRAAGALSMAVCCLKEAGEDAGEE